MVAAGLATAAASAGPLPRLTIAIPAGGDPAQMVRAVQSAGLRELVVLLPPVTWRFDGGDQADRTLAPSREAAVTSLPAALPAGAQLHRLVAVEIGAIPGSGRARQEAVEARTSMLVAALGLEAQSVAGLAIEVVGPPPSQDVLSFLLATIVVQARAAKPGLHVDLVLTPDLLGRPDDALARLLAYADSVTVSREAVESDRDGRLRRLAAGRSLTVKADGPVQAGAGAVETFLDTMLGNSEFVPDAILVEAQAPADGSALGRAIWFLTQSMPGGYEIAPLARAPVAPEIDGKPAASGRAFVAGHTPDAGLLVRTGATRGSPRALTLAAATGDTVQFACFDAVDGRRQPATFDGTGRPSCGTDAPYTFLHVRRSGSQERLFEAVDVRGRAELSVEEVIARWQAAREAERRTLDHYSAVCLQALHFEASNFGVGVDVALELRLFVDRNGVNDWVQTGLFVNGVRFKKGREFPLPQLEPERVMTKPLELSMDEKYRYRLDGVEQIDGRMCYVIGVEPTTSTERLYAGRVWIDGVTFRQVRMQFEQRSGSNNLASHVETQDFGPVRDAEGREFTLLQRVLTEETLNMAGRAVTLERLYRFSDYQVNTGEFAANLDTARRSAEPMYRDTAEGLRALRKEGDQRVVETASGKRIRSLVGGVMVDGTYNFPVPLAGVSWVDFDFRGKGSQLSTVFAGLFLAGNLSKQRGPKLRTSIEASLSALPVTDRLFDGDVELKGRRVRWFEQSAGAVAVWQARPGLSLSASGRLAAIVFQRTGETDPALAIPSVGTLLRTWIEAKYARRSLELTAYAEPVVRLTGWNDYHEPGSDAADPPRTYLKYWFEATKYTYVGKLTRAGLSAAYYGGAQLDRFSRYHSSFLAKPRILGLPSGVDAFDTVAVAGGYYGVNILELVRFEGAYNHAWVRNRDESSAFRQFDGLDFDIGTGGPWGTYLQATVGVSLRGNLARYSSRWGAYVLIFKPMKN